MNKKTWIILITVVAVVLLGVVVWQLSSSDDEDNLAAQQTESTATAEDDQTSTPVDEPAAIESADLVSVGSYNGSGLATRTVEGEFVHEVTAKLGDPTPGDFYEGWLVGPSVVSTGKLVSEAEGRWSLVFTSSKDLSEHNSIVITEETEANGLDGVPEDHVLEGLF